jgi:hypothetical protein
MQSSASKKSWAALDVNQKRHLSASQEDIGAAAALSQSALVETEAKQHLSELLVERNPGY